ncbi:MAG: ketoacyl-ACP synthase III [Eubacterium sp.]|nr:ketoacyl-ACP synthase III [Eubacterium sp.]
MSGIKIIGTGAYVPEFVATNEMFTKFIDTSDEWIATRTGISERRISPDKPNFWMSAEAAKEAIANAKISASDIDAIIVSTCSPDFFYPNTACLIQHIIGADGCAAIDINTACTGFITALDIARVYLAADIYKTVLVVAGERLTSQIDYEDRSSCILFGDGAGAAVVQKGDGIYYSHMGAKGDMLQDLYCKVEYNRNNPFYTGDDILKDIINTPQKERYLQMDGKAVYKFAVDAMADAVDKVCEQSGFNINDLDLVIPHQANIRIIQSALKKMDVDESKVYTNLETHGNTSSSCIPMCLSELDRAGRLQRGMKICLVGFGAGLTYGACIFEY